MTDDEVTERVPGLMYIHDELLDQKIEERMRAVLKAEDTLNSFDRSLQRALAERQYRRDNGVSI